MKFLCLICERSFSEMENAELCQMKHTKPKEKCASKRATAVDSNPAPIVKIVPTAIGVWDPNTGRYQPNAYVLRVRIHPPGSHGGSPIRSELTALELATAYGSRWYGCAQAWVLSDGASAAMELCPGQEHDEVLAKWRDGQSRVAQ